MADYDIRLVTDDQELGRLHRVSAEFEPEAQACAGYNQPPLKGLLTAHRVYAAYIDDEPVAFVLCSARRMFWMVGRASHLATACVALSGVIHHEFAPAWGSIENVELRAAIANASGGMIEDDGTGCRWIGD